MYAQHNLTAALAFKQLDPSIKLFPAYWKNGHKPLVSWSRESSGDPAQLRAWYATYTAQGLDIYFCAATRQSGLTCLDLDNKGGKTGSASLIDLEQIHGRLPATLVARTPSSGWHCWFTGESKVSFGKIGNGIDTPVMAPVPGSFVPGKGHYQPAGNNGLSALPAWIKTMAGIMRDRDPDRDLPMCEWDQAHNIRFAVALLKKAQPVVQGDNADAKTFRLAARLHDKAISMGTAIELMLTHWYPRCTPNNKPAFIERKVENAYRYALDRPGNDTPDALWQPPARTEMFTAVSELVKGLPTVKWTIKKYMEQETINVWVGQSNTYKSFLAIDAAMAVATGQAFAGQPTTSGPAFYLAAEGRGGMSRRMIAASRRRKLRPDQLRHLYVGNYTVPLDTDTGVRHLIEKIQDLELLAGRPALIVIDTLAASFGTGDENSTKDMNIFVNHLIRIRDDLKCSILVIHHTGLGDKTRGRGSSALYGNTDSTTLVTKVKDEPYMCLNTPRKMKDGEPTPDTYFKVAGINLGTNEDGETVTSLTIEFDPAYNAPAPAEKWTVNQTIVRDILHHQKQQGKDWLDLGYLWEFYRTVYPDKHNGGRPRSDNFKTMVRTMGEQGKITIDGHMVTLGSVDPVQAAMQTRPVPTTPPKKALEDTVAPSLNPGARAVQDSLNRQPTIPEQGAVPLKKGYDPLKARFP